MTTGARLPALDSLRGVAILAVFGYHAFFWSGLSGDSALTAAVALATRPGWLGVDLFFVLSGFLITGRLLDNRHLPAGAYYRWFYLRRALRILPLYYLSLAVIGGVMYRAGEVSAPFMIASVFYLPNFALVAGFLATAPLAVLWSLGIEEQVYLIWPWLVRRLTNRMLLASFVVLGLVQPLLRYDSMSTRQADSLSMITWLRLDGFAWGGALAILVRTPGISRRWLSVSGAATIAGAGGLAVLCSAFGVLSRRTNLGAALQFACADLLFAGLLAVVLFGGREAAATPRRSGSVLRYFGRISYCLYLVHQFVFWIFDRLTGAVHPSTLGPAAVRAAIVLAVCLGIAELSWRYLEGPCLALRPVAT